MRDDIWISLEESRRESSDRKWIEKRYRNITLYIFFWLRGNYAVCRSWMESGGDYVPKLNCIIWKIEGHEFCTKSRTIWAANGSRSLRRKKMAFSSKISSRILFLSFQTSWNSKKFQDRIQFFFLLFKDFAKIQEIDRVEFFFLLLPNFAKFQGIPR